MEMASDGNAVLDRDITLSATETQILLWNLTAGYSYNVSVAAATEWEESEKVYGIFNTGKQWKSLIVF